MIPRHHVPKPIMNALEATGDFKIKRGKRHLLFYVKDRFCGIAPLCVSGDGTGRPRAMQNVLSQIRRASR